MNNDQDFSAFSERGNIRQIYEDRGCPREFKYENVLYEFRNDRFILTRFPADHPAKIFTIPDGVNEIESDAFSDCARLTMLTFPESLTYVGDHAFSGDVSMTIRILGDVEFDESAFCEPDDWHFFYAETNVKLILKRCSKTHAWARILGIDFEFDDGIEATEVVTEIVKNNVMVRKSHQIGAITRYTGTDKVLRIPAEIDLRYGFEIGTMVNPYEIQHSQHPEAILTYVDRDDNMHYLSYLLAAHIGDHAFAGCQTIEDVSLPNTITEIWTKAFAGCSSLRRVLIPTSVTQIAPDAFANCPRLTLEVVKGSYALQYAMENSINYLIVG